MARTATRVAAAVGATVVMIGLATPALACTNIDSGGRSATVSSDRATDPGKASDSDKKAPLTLAERQAKLDQRIADKLAWLDAIKAKVTASTRLSAVQQTAVLARVQSSEDALTQLRADVAAATSLDGLRAVLRAADVNLFRHWGWHHGRHLGDRQHNGGFASDRGQRNGGNAHRGGSDRHGSGFHASNHSGGSQH
jgi:hypothetical protein